MRRTCSCRGLAIYIELRTRSRRGESLAPHRPASRNAEQLPLIYWIKKVCGLGSHPWVRIVAKGEGQASVTSLLIWKGRLRVRYMLARAIRIWGEDNGTTLAAAL